MHNVYPGPGSGSDDGLPPSVNGIVSGSMGRLLEGYQLAADGPVHAHSILGRDALARLSAVAGTEPIRRGREAEEAELASFDEMAALMEEAPGV